MKYIKLILLVIISFSSAYADSFFTFKYIKDIEKEIYSLNLIESTLFKVNYFDYNNLSRIDFEPRNSEGDTLSYTYFAKLEEKYYKIDYYDIKQALRKLNIDISGKSKDYRWASGAYNLFVPSAPFKVCILDSFFYATVLFDSNSFINKDLERYLIKYNFVTKDIKVIYNPIYDSVSKKTVHNLNMMILNVLHNKLFLMSVGDYNEIKKDVKTPLYHCRINENDSIEIICRCRYNLAPNSLSSASRFLISELPYGFRWLEMFIDTTQLGALITTINEYSYDTDSIRVISSNDLGIGRNNMKYMIHSIPMRGDSTIIATCVMYGEILRIFPDNTVKVFYPNDSLKFQLDLHVRKAYFPVYDKDGNIWINYPPIKVPHIVGLNEGRYPEHNKLIRIDKDDNITLFDFDDLGRMWKEMYYFNDRYIVFVAEKNEEKWPHRVIDDSTKLIFFDTYAASSVKGNTEGYAVGDIKSIALYPNPSTDMTNLKIKFIRKDIKSIDIKLYNSTGELIKEYSEAVEVQDFESNLQINTSGLPKGYYYVTIVTDRNKEYRGLIIK